jgi:hypothetical protein
LSNWNFFMDIFVFLLALGGYIDIFW